MRPQICTTFVVFTFWTSSFLNNHRSDFFPQLATQLVHFFVYDYPTSKVNFFKAGLTSQFVEKLRIRSKAFLLLSVTTFPRIYQKSLVRHHYKGVSKKITTSTAKYAFLIFRRLYFFSLESSKCQLSSQKEKGTNFCYCKCRPSSFTSVSVLHFINCADYLITFLMMCLLKYCHVFLHKSGYCTKLRCTNSE